MSQDALVLGGGLAGIAAAVRLAEAGRRVTLLETRQKLGGRATSFIDPQTGDLLDNCQHVLMGCCTTLIDLYKRLGVGDQISWHPDLHFADKEGHRDLLCRWPLPAPGHLARLVTHFRTLSARDRLAIAGGMIAIMGAGRQGRRKAAGQTFAQWLREHGQTETAIDRFWGVVIVSALNESAHSASAEYGLMVFQDGFLCHRDAYVMGLSRVPLIELYDQAEVVLKGRGGQVKLGTSIERLHFDKAGGRVAGVQTADGVIHEAEIVVSALPFDRLHKVTDETMRAADARLRRLMELTVSPIIGIHLQLDRRVMSEPHLIFVDSPLQWIFSKSIDPATGGQYLHGVISGAQEWVDRSAEDILSMAMAELGCYCPAAREAKLEHGRVVKEKRATFRVLPGVEELRPEATGAIGNLYLAGDWCRTGWPATMEGAARSGYMAAGAALGVDLTVPDMAGERIYRVAARVLESIFSS